MRLFIKLPSERYFSHELMIFDSWEDKLSTFKKIRYKNRTKISVEVTISFAHCNGLRLQKMECHMPSRRVPIFEFGLRFF